MQQIYFLKFRQNYGKNLVRRIPILLPLFEAIFFPGLDERRKNKWMSMISRRPWHWYLPNIYQPAQTTCAV